MKKFILLLAALAVTSTAAIAADPVTGIYLAEYAPGETITLENMGCTLITPKYEPEGATGASFAVEFGDESIVTFYKSIKGLVAHRAGTTTMTLSVPDTDIRAEYIITVKGPDPENKPDDDFADGIFYLNEEWFTHTSGSINYIDADGRVFYRAYGNQNDNMAFGATSQFATIYAGKLIVMSKQAWDGGDTREKTGGRVVVADAQTLKHIGSVDEIGGDGRACVGVNPNKVYLSHTKGIRVMDIDDDAISVADSDIAGIEIARNGQMGDMVKAGQYVFAVCVGSALYVIDSETDEVVKSFDISGIQTVAQSLDGRVWIGCAKTLQPIDPETLELGDVLNISVGSIGCSSSSWRPGNLRASTRTNTLFWSTGNWNGSNGDLIRWDIDEVADPSTITEKLYTHGSVAGATYSTGYGTPNYDSRSDTWVYCSTAGFGANAMLNRIHFVDATTGELKHTIELNKYFWFPSVALIPDKFAPEIHFDDIELPILEECDEEYTYDLSTHVSDPDSHPANINISIPEMAPVAADSAPIAEVKLSGKRLTVRPLTNGCHVFTLMAESNGLTASKTVTVHVGDRTSGIESALSAGTVYCDGHFIAFRDLQGVSFTIYDLNGRQVESVTPADNASVIYPALAPGFYILRGSNGMTIKIKINR